MYRLLVERANPLGAFGDDHELSPFWGYASQLAWQHRSGRLGDRDRAIDRTSWWGACNYALCVIPFAAAATLGIVPVVALDTGGYTEALPAWNDALRAMVAVRRGDDLEPVRFAIWRAHLASIELAVRRHAHEFRALAERERAFARGWVRMVDLFGAAALRTDLVTLAPHGAGALPSRMLGDRDDDLPRAERSTARRVIALGARPSWRWPIELAVWRRIMRTRAARDEVDALLAGMFGRGRRAWHARVRMLAYAARP